MGIIRGNGDEELREENMRACPKFELTLKDWMWMHQLIGETQGTLTSIAMQSTDEERKHLVAPCLALEKNWELFIQKIRGVSE